MKWKLYVSTEWNRWYRPAPCCYNLQAIYPPIHHVNQKMNNENTIYVHILQNPYHGGAHVQWEERKKEQIISKKMKCA